jgi:hypothetical protein
MTMYFSTNPDIATHTIASLTAYLTEQLPHMIIGTSPTHLGATMSSSSSSHVGLLNSPSDMSIHSTCGVPHQTYLQTLHALAATANSTTLPTSLPGRQAADPNSKRSKSKARKPQAGSCSPHQLLRPQSLPTTPSYQSPCQHRRHPHRQPPSHLWNSTNQPPNPLHNFTPA